MLPLIKEGIVRGVPALMGLARSYISGAVKDPKALAAAATRIGMDASKASVGALTRAASDNKMTTALILWELGGAGLDILSEMASSDSDVAGLLSTLQASAPESVTTTSSVTDIVGLEDEFQDISVAVAICGSMARLESLIRAIGTDPQTRAMYNIVRTMGRRL